MSIKIVKTHTAETHAEAMKLADGLRNKCIPCSDPMMAPHFTEPKYIYHVDQYVRTEYPEI